MTEVIRCFERSRRGKFMTVALTMFTGAQVASSIWYPAGENPFALHIMTVTVLGGLGILLVPPSVIVLASSVPATYQLVDLVGEWTFPLRQVALLDGKNIRVGRLPPRWFPPESNFRTSGKSWRQSVHEMVEVTQLVIVDTRTASAGVIEEVQHMLHPHRIFRALFVTDNDESSPALDRAGLPRNSVFRCTCRALPAELARFHVYHTLIPQWVPVGAVSNVMNLRPEVEKRVSRYKPFVLPQVMMEPSPGYFGPAGSGFRKKVLEAFMQQADMAEGDVTGSFPAEALKSMRKQAGLLKRALTSGRVDFFFAMLPNGCRATALVMRQP
jgi:hypothetical protein